MVTRTLILIPKKVAPKKWGEAFATLVAQAQSGQDGMTLVEQEKVKEYWNIAMVNVPLNHAAFRQADNGDGVHLYIQNY